MNKSKKTKQGYIYPATRGNAHTKGFAYYLCCHTGDFFIVDCVPCDKDGNYAPGIECGIPTDVTALNVNRGFKLEY